MDIFPLLAKHYTLLPHCRALGMRLESTDNGTPVISVLPRDDLKGNPKNGSIHGGVITTLTDILCASAVAAKLREVQTLVTLDMRIDYMHPADPAERIYGSAHCYRLAGQVAFVRAQCWQNEPDNPISLGTAVFMCTPLSAEQQDLMNHYLQEARKQAGGAI